MSLTQSCFLQCQFTQEVWKAGALCFSFFFFFNFFPQYLIWVCWTEVPIKILQCKKIPEFCKSIMKLQSLFFLFPQRYFVGSKPSPCFVSCQSRVGRKRKKVNKSLHEGSKTKRGQSTGKICDFLFLASHDKTHLPLKQSWIHFFLWSR